MVGVDAASGTYAGAPARRNTVLQIVAQNAVPSGVSLNGVRLPQQPTAAAFGAAESGSYVSDGVITVKAGSVDVLRAKEFDVRMGSASWSRMGCAEE